MPTNEEIMLNKAQQQILRRLNALAANLRNAIAKRNEPGLASVISDLLKLQQTHGRSLQVEVRANLSRAYRLLHQGELSDADLALNIALHHQAGIAKSNREMGLTKAQQKARVLRVAGKVLARKGSYSELLGMLSKLAAQINQQRKRADAGAFIPIADLYAFGSQIALISGYVQSIAKNHRDPQESRNLMQLASDLEGTRRSFNDSLASLLAKMRVYRENESLDADELRIYGAEREGYRLQRLIDSLRSAAHVISRANLYRRGELA